MLRFVQLDIPVQKGTAVCISGAGGKTTLLYQLAREAAQAGFAAAVITTTHIMFPDEADFQYLEQPDPTAIRAGRVVFAGTPAADGKLAAPDAGMLCFLQAQADILLAETDGSKRLPIKFPNDTEPVLLPGAAKHIVVMGLSALGKPLGQVCHRAGLACRALGCRMDEPVTPELLARLILAGYGGFCPDVLLNQADTPALQAQGETVGRLLYDGGIGKVTVLSLNQGGFGDAGIYERRR